MWTGSPCLLPWCLEDCTFYITSRHRQQAGIRAGVASAQFPLWREETSMCHTFHRSFSPCLVSLQTQQATGVLISDSQPIATLPNACWSHVTSSLLPWMQLMPIPSISFFERRDQTIKYLHCFLVSYLLNTTNAPCTYLEGWHAREVGIIRPSIESWNTAVPKNQVYTALTQSICITKTLFSVAKHTTSD